MRNVLMVGLVMALLSGCDSSDPAPKAAPDAKQPTQSEALPAVKNEKPAAVVAAPATVAVEIEGMHCDGCQQWVKDILEELDGVASADVSLEKHSAVVTMKPGAKFPETKARAALEKDNYKLKPVVNPAPAH
jgi:Cu2+-exporting ATPase